MRTPIRMNTPSYILAEIHTHINSLVHLKVHTHTCTPTHIFTHTYTHHNMHIHIQTFIKSYALYTHEHSHKYGLNTKSILSLKMKNPLHSTFVIRVLIWKQSIIVIWQYVNLIHIECAYYNLKKCLTVCLRYTKRACIPEDII